MKRSTKLIAAALSLAAIVSAASCNSGSGNSTSDGNSSGGERVKSETTTTAAPVETYERNEGVQEAVKDAAGDIVDTTLKPKKLVFMGNWTIDNTLPAVEMLRQVYNEPDFEVESIVVDWASRFQRLGQAIASGDPPDIFPFENEYFPFSVYNNYFQSIDGVIDMSGPEWDGWRELSDNFVWAGKHYVAPIESYPAQVLFYRRSVIAEAGLEDPYELFLEGKWDWDAFLDMADKFQMTGTNKYICDGWYLPSMIFSTTGVPCIGVKDGKVVNNYFDANVERAANVVAKIFEQGYYHEGIVDGSISEDDWCNGNTLFWGDGTWFYQGNGHKYCEKYRWTWDEPDFEIEVNKKDENGKTVKDADGNTVKEKVWVDYDDVFFVPTPKDPNADKYYHDYKVFGYAFCSSSTNTDGFKAWTQCNIACLYDEAVQAAAKAQLMENEKWTDKQVEFRMQLYSVKDTPLTPSFDFRKGIGGDSANNDGTSPTDWIVFAPTRSESNTFTVARAEYNGAINKYIEEINASVS